MSLFLAGLAEARHKETKNLWLKACEYDKIDPKTNFAIFSSKNKYAKKYNEMTALMQNSFRETEFICNNLVNPYKV